MPEAFDRLGVGLFVDFKHRKLYGFSFTSPSAHFKGVPMHNLVLLAIQRHFFDRLFFLPSKEFKHLRLE